MVHRQAQPRSTSLASIYFLDVLADERIPLMFHDGETARHDKPEGLTFRDTTQKFIFETPSEEGRKIRLMQQCVREERVLLSVVSRARNPVAGRSSELPQAHKEIWERCGTIQSRRGVIKE